MDAIGTIALPIFALIGLGFAARRWNLIDGATTQGLNDFVYGFALPALLIRNVAGAPVSALFAPDLLAAYYLASLVLLAAVLLWRARGRTRGIGEAGVAGLAASFGNVGYLGIPLLFAAFGPEVGLIAVTVMLFDNILMMPIAIACLEAGRSDGASAGAAAKGVALGLVRNPLIAAVVIGLVPAFLEVRLPGPLQAFIDLLAAAAAPCALFALGCSLVAVPVASTGKGVMALVAAKLVVHPALVALAVFVLIPLAPAEAQAAVVMASLPTAATAFVLAERYRTGAATVASSILIGHVLSVVTVSALLFIFL